MAQGASAGLVVKVMIEVADAGQLQLLGDAIRQAATIRSTAAGVAAQGVVDDPAITDTRPDAQKLLRILADANWLRGVADNLPALVLAEAPVPTGGATAHPLGGSQVYPTVEPVFSAPPPTVDARQPAPAAPADLALRALTLSPGARLDPDSAMVDVAGPPPIPDTTGILEMLGGTDEDELI